MLGLGALLRDPVAGERYGQEEVTMDLDGSANAVAGEEASCDTGVRKRFRGAHPVPVQPGIVVPKSTRMDHSAPQPPPQEAGPHQRSTVPALNLAPAAAATGAQRLTIPDRADAPAMLNLEEINMSEEELISSYDPNNEENNYLLPDHLYKQLQLKQYRQACSEVIHNAVYLGGYQVAGDLECLRRNQITHIVNMAADVCDSSFPEHFSYLTYYLKDTNSEDISPLFYRTLDWMQNAIEGGGRVLVHCREGVSRSATMVIAYLMWRLGLPFEAAHEKLRKARPICNPNTGFTCQLLVLGKRLGITGAGGQAGAPSGVPDRPLLFRVTPHHPKEPFLLLAPAEWPRSWPHFDPRFGWVVQQGQQLVLWLGPQVPDPEAVKAAVRHHARCVEAFERRSMSVTVVAEGMESPLLAQALSAVPGAPADPCGSASPNPAFDADFEVLRSCAAGAATAAGAEEALAGVGAPTVHGIGGG